VQSVTTVAMLRNIVDKARRGGARVGFVPTMGFLHQGHVSLMDRARQDTALVVSSIFVNPLQFAVGEDLSTYPRDLEQDTSMAEAAGVDVLFVPPVEEMYPREVITEVAVAPLARLWEGATRPTHFTGVSTVVSKLFNLVGPCSAYFGEKDFQQLAVIRRMVSDLSFDVEVVGCPIVREADGLALSSRNTYLDADERSAATVLRRALDVGLSVIESGERDPDRVGAMMTAVVDAEPLAQLDYAAAVDAASLEEPVELSGEVRLLVAAQVGRPRLIDNDGVVLIESGSVPDIGNR
jgi:pantoate--beta-alanine ligase